MAYTRRKSSRTTARKTSGRSSAKRPARRSGRGGSGVRGSGSVSRIRIELVGVPDGATGAARPRIAGLTQNVEAKAKKRSF